MAAQFQNSKSVSAACTNQTQFKTNKLKKYVSNSQTLIPHLRNAPTRW